MQPFKKRRVQERVRLQSSRVSYRPLIVGAYEFYQKELEGSVNFQKYNDDSLQNYSYFPIILESEDQLKKIEKEQFFKQ